MREKAVDPATAEAEALLREEMAINQAYKIDPAYNRLIERLLTKSETLQPLYAELAQGLLFPEQRREVLKALIQAAIVAHPDKTKKIREQKQLAKELNQEIRILAKGLFKLTQRLQERNELCPDIESLRLPSLIELIRDAANFCAGGNSEDQYRSYLFDAKLYPELAPLGRFDCKYWPSAEKLILALAEALLIQTDPDNSPEPQCLLMGKAIQSRSHSKADFIRAISEVIDDLRQCSDVFPYIPAHFKLTQDSIERFYGAVTGHTWAEGTIKKQQQRRNQKARDSSRQKSG